MNTIREERSEKGRDVTNDFSRCQRPEMRNQGPDVMQNWSSNFLTIV